MFPKRKTDLLWFLNLHSSLVPRLLFVISAGDGNTRIYWSRLWVLDFAASKFSKFMGWILQYSDRLNVNRKKSRQHFVKVYISPLSVGLGSRVCRHECQKCILIRAHLRPKVLQNATPFWFTRVTGDRDVGKAALKPRDFTADSNKNIPEKNKT